MEIKKQNQEAKLQLVGDLEGRVNQLRDTLKEIIGGKQFKDYALNISDPSILNGSVTAENAIPGQWDLEVLKLAENAGALSNWAPDKDETQFGVGYLRFDTPDGGKDVYINNGNNTLTGMASTINKAQMGISATVVEDGAEGDDGYRMIISSKYFGDNNEVQFPTIYLLDGDQDLYFDQEKAAKNGVVKVNGFEVEVPDNVMEEVIPGVTIDLKSAEPGKKVNIQLTEDVETIEGKLKGFVDSMNSILTFIQQQNAVSEGSDTSRTLGGDSMLRNLENRVRRMIQQPILGTGSSIQRLQELGVEFNRYGTLDFKQDKFVAQVKKNSANVITFFRGNGQRGSGFIGAVNTLVNSSLSSGFGLIANRKRGIQGKIDRIDRSIVGKEERLARKEQGLRRKFSRLEEQLSKINAQGAQVSAIGGGGGAGLGGLLG